MKRVIIYLRIGSEGGKATLTARRMNIHCFMKTRIQF